MPDQLLVQGPAGRPRGASDPSDEEPGDGPRLDAAPRQTCQGAHPDPAPDPRGPVRPPAVHPPLVARHPLLRAASPASLRRLSQTATCEQVDVPIQLATTGRLLGPTGPGGH